LLQYVQRKVVAEDLQHGKCPRDGKRRERATRPMLAAVRQTAASRPW
jgi:hypothetical protein